MYSVHIHQIFQTDHDDNECNRHVNKIVSSSLVLAIHRTFRFFLDTNYEYLSHTLLKDCSLIFDDALQH